MLMLFVLADAWLLWAMGIYASSLSISFSLDEHLQEFFSSYITLGTCLVCVAFPHASWLPHLQGLAVVVGASAWILAIRHSFHSKAWGQERLCVVTANLGVLTVGNAFLWGWRAIDLTGP